MGQEKGGGGRAVQRGWERGGAPEVSRFEAGRGVGGGRGGIGGSKEKRRL